MSQKLESPTGFGVPPPPSLHTYPPQHTDPGPSHHPSLPPMSSLLRHDQNQQAPPSHFPTGAYFGQYNMRHPLWQAQADPNAPVQHIYHPPQSHNNSHFAQAPEPELVPLSTQYSFEFQSNHSAPPQPRTRKNIVQRRTDNHKDTSRERRESGESAFRYNDTYHHTLPSVQAEAPQSRRDSAQSQISMPPNSTQSQGLGSRSMPISNLLSNEPTPVIKPPQPTYTLRMRQQPIAARACGFGERDRRVIDPPPILQMDVSDPSASPEEIRALIRQPYSVVHCVLWDPIADRDDTAMPGTTEKRQQRRLMGTLVASPFVGKDEHDVEGCFFTFPDLSVRTPGTYSLKFSLVTLNPREMRSGAREFIKSVQFSTTFHVYNAKDFTGMRASTELTKTLKHQGCLISVKKGNAKSNGTHAREEDEDEDDDDDDDEDGAKNTASKRGKRPKQ